VGTGEERDGRGEEDGECSLQEGFTVALDLGIELLGVFVDHAAEEVLVIMPCDLRRGIAYMAEPGRTERAGESILESCNKSRGERHTIMDYKPDASASNLANEIERLTLVQQELLPARIDRLLWIHVLLLDQRC